MSMQKTFNKIFRSLFILAQILWDIINLNKKLLVLLLYFILFIYIFARFANSYLYLLLSKILLLNEDLKRCFIDILSIELMDLMMRGINRSSVKNILFEENIIGVFFNLKLI